MSYKSDLADHFDPDLHLLIKGKTYRIPDPDYNTGQRFREVAIKGVPPQTQINLAIEALGPTFLEMAADGVGWSMVLHAGRTALLHFGVSPDIGEVHWDMAHLGRLIDIEEVSKKFAEVQAAKERLAEMVAATNT